MQHVFQTMFGFLRQFAFLLARAASTIAGVLHEIWHEVSLATGPAGQAQHPVFVHGRWFIYTTPAWWAPALAVVGFILLVRYSQLRPTSAQGDLALSGLVGVMGIALIGLLN